jgi:hypothetical protein
LDVRYQFVTTDGGQIFVHGKGATTATGELHGLLQFETGSPKYYWMNRVNGKYLVHDEWQREKLRTALGIAIGKSSLKLDGAHIKVNVFTVCQ